MDTQKRPDHRDVCEDGEMCWICLSEDQPLIQPCKCPRRVHAKCLGRWQLQSAGRTEEKLCRFCSLALPDWRDAVTPEGLRPASPVMSIHHGGQTYMLKVAPGPEGMKRFQRDVRRLLGLDEDQEFEISFECRVPGVDTTDSSRMELRGMSSYDAAVYCASLTAAERLKKAQEERQAAAGQAQERGSADVPAAAGGSYAAPGPSSSGSSAGTAVGSGSSGSGGAAAGADQSRDVGGDNGPLSTGGSVPVASSAADSSRGRGRGRIAVPGAAGGAGSGAAGAADQQQQQLMNAAGLPLIHNHTLTGVPSGTPAITPATSPPLQHQLQYHPYHQQDHPNGRSRSASGSARSSGGGGSGSNSGSAMPRSTSLQTMLRHHARRLLSGCSRAPSQEQEQVPAPDHTGDAEAPEPQPIPLHYHNVPLGGTSSNITGGGGALPERLTPPPSYTGMYQQQQQQQQVRRRTGSVGTLAGLSAAAAATAAASAGSGNAAAAPLTSQSAFASMFAQSQAAVAAAAALTEPLQPAAADPAAPAAAPQALASPFNAATAAAAAAAGADPALLPDQQQHPRQLLHSASSSRQHRFPAVCGRPMMDPLPQAPGAATSVPQLLLGGAASGSQLLSSPLISRRETRDVCTWSLPCQDSLPAPHGALDAANSGISGSSVAGRAFPPVPEPAAAAAAMEGGAAASRPAAGALLPPVAAAAAAGATAAGLGGIGSKKQQPQQLYAYRIVRGSQE